MRRTTVFAMIVGGGVIYYTLKATILGQDVTHAINAILAAGYWSAMALAIHWTANRTPQH